jgi:pilus assembly protein Flp/PilA
MLGALNPEGDGMTSFLTRFVEDESGATAIEYSLIATLIAMSIILGASQIGTKLNSTFNNVSSAMK